jgi:DNA-binding response OmpR family regulator
MKDTEPLVTGRAASAAATILVIDAQLLASSALAYSLRDQGFDAHPIRADLAKVQAAIRTHRPGLVLLDLDLCSAPGRQPFDGANLIGPLRAQGWTVMVLTDTADLDRITRALAQGAASWIVKGSTFAELVHATVEMIQASGQRLPPGHAALTRRRKVRA